MPGGGADRLAGLARLTRGRSHSRAHTVAGQVYRDSGPPAGAGDDLADGLTREGTTDPPVPIDTAERRTSRIKLCHTEGGALHHTPRTPGAHRAGQRIRTVRHSDLTWGGLGDVHPHDQAAGIVDHVTHQQPGQLTAPRGDGEADQHQGAVPDPTERLQTRGGDLTKVDQ